MEKNVIFSRISLTPRVPMVKLAINIKLGNFTNNMLHDYNTYSLSFVQICENETYKLQMKLTK